MLQTIAELRRNGASDREIQKVRSGVKLHQGVYTQEAADEWQRFELRSQAALLRLKEGAALAGPAAARHWGLPLVGDAPSTIHVRGVRRGRYAKEVRVVSGGSAELVEHAGFQVTTAAWTVVDCARLLPLRDALIIADSALQQELCTLADLQAACAALGKAKGVAGVRWVIANADPRSESPGETWMRMVCRELGYPVTSQVVVDVDGHRYRLDLVIDGTMIALEFDGAVKYGSDPARTVLAEKRRQAQIERLGYRVLRVVWDQLADPARLDQRIRSALGDATIHRRRGAR